MIFALFDQDNSEDFKPVLANSILKLSGPPNIGSTSVMLLQSLIKIRLRLSDVDLLVACIVNLVDASHKLLIQAE